MRHAKWISAYEIDLWANAIDARSRLPELIRRLIHATVPPAQIEHIEFSGSEETHRPGYDGTTKVKTGNAKVPEDIAYWEMGVNVGVKAKLDEDYQTRVDNRPTGDYSKVTYIAVTPRDYQKKGDWITEKKKLKDWGDVRVYDSNDLEQWLETAAAVALWLMPHVKKQNVGSMVDLSSYWENMQGRLRGRLPPEVLLTSREGTVKEFEKWSFATNSVLSIRGQTPQEVIDVFSAWVQSLPLDKQDSIASRTIVVDDTTAWSQLTDSPHPLYLVCGAQLQLDADKIAEAQRKGHHVLRPVFGTQSRDAIQLERMDRGELSKRLVAAGMLENAAANLASTSGGWFSVLKRQYSSISDDRDPAWANAPAATDLAPLVLIGAWNDTNKSDIEIVAAVCGRPYATLRPTVNHWSKQPDAPIRWAHGVWEFVSLIDAWTYLHKTIEPSQLDALEAAAIQLLAIDHPALDLVPEERWQAGIKGKKLEHSEELRSALARSLAMLATRDWPNDISDTTSLQTRVNRTVRKILPKEATWKRWSSLGGILPTLAEAAPEVVLDAVEEGIKGDNPPQKELFAQERGGAMGRAEHTGLLWALERLAWDRSLLPRVSLALARLAEIDPGGQWGNRPQGSLHDVFFSWMPHTTASLEDRLGVLKLLFVRHPDVAWRLLLSILPKHHESIMVHNTPEWRYWAEGWKRDMSHAEYDQSITEFLDLAVAELNKTPARWSQLIANFPSVTRKGVEKLLTALDAINIDALKPDERKALWDELRKMVNHHGEFADAKWAYPADIVARLRTVSDKLSPTDAIELAIPLFSHRYAPIGPRDMPWEEREKLLSAKRIEMLKTVLASHGIKGVLELATKVENIWAVGWELAKGTEKTYEGDVLPTLLVAESESIRKFAEGFATVRIFNDTIAARNRTLTDWTGEQATAYVALLPFDRETWDTVAKMPAPISENYWSKTERQSFDLPAADVEFAARKFISAGRVHSAVDLLGMSRDKPDGKLKPDTLLTLLELCATTPSTERPGQLTGYHIEELIADVQSAHGIDEKRLAALEWAFLDLLDRHSRHRPETLHKALATQPKFFVELICATYHRRDEKKEDRTPPTPDMQAKAKKAWQLLHDWGRIPGTQADGSVSLDELRTWMQTMRKLAEKEGRLVVADITIGGIFAHSPADADGAWPCSPVQQIIEETVSTEMERGFMTGLFNSRGFTTRAIHEGGKQERDLATKFRGLSEKVLTRFPKVAKLLGQMASDYEEQAKRQDLEAAAERE